MEYYDLKFIDDSGEHFDENGDNYDGLGEGWFSYLGRSKVKGWFYGRYI